MTTSNLKISGFQGEYRFLSNFYHAPLTVTGIPYLNSEAAYQASKTTDLDIRAQFSNLDPATSKRKGRTILLRPDWNLVLKLEMMELCLRSKFMNNPLLREKLFLTGERKLEETNNWGDTF